MTFLKKRRIFHDGGYNVTIILFEIMSDNLYGGQNVKIFQKRRYFEAVDKIKRKRHTFGGGGQNVTILIIEIKADFS